MWNVSHGEMCSNDSLECSDPNKVSCEEIRCPSLSFANNTDSIITDVTRTDALLGTSVIVKCKNYGEDFGGNLKQLNYTCGIEGWIVERKELCPNHSLTCLDPLPQNCSFNGCLPLTHHDPSFSVVSFGGNHPSLVGSRAHITCGVDVEGFVNISGQFRKIEYSDQGYFYIQDYKSNECQNQENFQLNFADCQGDSVSLEFDQCSTGCLNFNFTATVLEVGNFAWSDDDPSFLFNNLTELESFLIADNWSDRNILIGHHFNLTCSENRTWTFLNDTFKDSIDLASLHKIPCMSTQCTSPEKLIPSTSLTVIDDTHMSMKCKKVNHYLKGLNFPPAEMLRLTCIKRPGKLPVWRFSDNVDHNTSVSCFDGGKCEGLDETFLNSSLTNDYDGEAHDLGSQFSVFCPSIVEEKGLICKHDQ